VRKRLAVAQQAMTVGEQRIHVRVSAGVAVYPDDGQNADALMRYADSAMYSAKRDGRA